MWPPMAQQFRWLELPREPLFSAPYSSARLYLAYTWSVSCNVFDTRCDISYLVAILARFARQCFSAFYGPQRWFHGRLRSYSLDSCLLIWWIAGTEVTGSPKTLPVKVGQGVGLPLRPGSLPAAARPLWLLLFVLLAPRAGGLWRCCFAEGRVADKCRAVSPLAVLQARGQNGELGSPAKGLSPGGKDERQFRL